MLTLIISMKSHAPDYSSIIPFTVAAVIVFGKLYDWIERNVLSVDRCWLNFDMNNIIFLCCVPISFTLGIYIYVYIAILSLYENIRRNTPNSEYTNLIANRNNAAYPTYSRCWNDWNDAISMMPMAMLKLNLTNTTTANEQFIQASKTLIHTIYAKRYKGIANSNNNKKPPLFFFCFEFVFISTEFHYHSTMIIIIIIFHWLR